MEDYNQLYKNFLFNIITEMVPYVKNLGVVPKTIEKGKIALEMEVGKAEYFTPGLGKLEGRASLTAKERSNALACLEADGKVKPVIRAEILNGKGEPVAAGTFTYSLKVMR